MCDLQVVLHDHLVNHARDEEKPGRDVQTHDKAYKNQQAELRRVFNSEREYYFKRTAKKRMTAM